MSILKCRQDTPVEWFVHKGCHGRTATGTSRHETWDKRTILLLCVTNNEGRKEVLGLLGQVTEMVEAVMKKEAVDLDVEVERWNMEGKR